MQIGMFEVLCKFLTPIMEITFKWCSVLAEESVTFLISTLLATLLNPPLCIRHPLHRHGVHL